MFKIFLIITLSLFGFTSSKSTNPKYKDKSLAVDVCVADLLSRDPRFGRMSETFGEDTHLVTEMIVSAVKGLQGDTKEISTHIGAVTKHFAGYAQVAGGKNFASIEISPRTLIDEILPPFKAAVQRANTFGIMASHGDLNGVASHANPEMLQFTGLDMKTMNEAGKYEVMVGTSSEEYQSSGFKLTK